MIELRWLEQDVVEPTPIGLIDRTIRVLQYREWPKGCIPGIEPEWVDVPVVVEIDNYHEVSV